MGFGKLLCLKRGLPPEHAGQQLVPPGAIHGLNQRLLVLPHEQELLIAERGGNRNFMNAASEIPNLDCRPT